MCATCGTQFPPESEPERCPICEDKRQYVGQDGQSWTSIADSSDPLTGGFVGYFTLKHFGWYSWDLAKCSWENRLYCMEK